MGRVLALLGLILFLPWSAAGQDVVSEGDVERLSAAHAHNDYLHDQPLLDALSRGFRGIEVDIILREDSLFVAHEEESIKAGDTIEALYLDPLTAWCERRGQSTRNVLERSASPDIRPILLLVDIKTDAAPTFEALYQILVAYEPMLTTFGPDVLVERCVSVVISGNRAKDRIASAVPRLAAIDGRPEDVAEQRYDVLAMPLISESWRKLFTWDGNGAMPAHEHERLVVLASKVRGTGRELRLWATPDRPGSARTAVWDALLGAGATLINTDDLDGLAAYLKARRAYD